MKILKELVEDMNSNADYLGGELENIRSQEKLENSFAEMQTELKSLKSMMNNAEAWISDLEDRKMEIAQSGHQTQNQKKKLPWDTTSHQSDWSSLISPQITNFGGVVEKREPSCILGGKVSWYSHYREQYGGIIEIYT